MKDESGQAENIVFDDFWLGSARSEGQCTATIATHIRDDREQFWNRPKKAIINTKCSIEIASQCRVNVIQDSSQANIC